MRVEVAPRSGNAPACVMSFESKFPTPHLVPAYTRMPVVVRSLPCHHRWQLELLGATFVSTACDPAIAVQRAYGAYILRHVLVYDDDAPLIC